MAASYGHRDTSSADDLVASFLLLQSNVCQVNNLCVSISLCQLCDNRNRSISSQGKNDFRNSHIVVVNHTLPGGKRSGINQLKAKIATGVSYADTKTTHE